MNTVIYNKKNEYRVKDLLYNNLGRNKTAFIGRCGNGPDNSLYLIFYSRIVLAEDPGRVWENHDCPVDVDRFVDIEIAIV